MATKLYRIYIYIYMHELGRRGMRGYSWGSQKERDHQEDEDVGGWTMLT
jgi:hypothetical protein